MAKNPYCVDCSHCKEPIKTDDPKVEVFGELCHLKCAEQAYQDYQSDLYADSVAAGEIIPGH